MKFTLTLTLKELLLGTVLLALAGGFAYQSYRFSEFTKETHLFELRVVDAFRASQ